MHKNKCSHHGDPPSPRLADGHHDALVGVHALYNLYISLSSSHTFVEALQLYNALQALQLYSSTTLYSIQPLQHPSGRDATGSWGRRGGR